MPGETTSLHTAPPDERTAPPLPEEIYLEVTNRCNLRCRTCPQYFGMAEPAADLTLARMTAVVEQLPVVRRAVLHGIGEPLLNPQLPEMIRYLKQRGAYVLFNSNGLLLRGNKLRALIESGLDELRVSIDGASPHTYRAVRGIDGFGRVLANVQRMSRLKTALGVQTPRLSLWMTGLRANVRELPDLVRAAHAAGVAEVYLQRLVYSERGLALAEESLYGRADAAELAAVRSAMALAEQLGITLRGSGEVRPLDQLDVVDGSNAPRRSCRRPWTLTYVTANGHVLPCCIAPFTAAPYASIVLGNLQVQSLAEVWNGPRYQRWREALRSASSPPEACRGCGADWSL